MKDYTSMINSLFERHQSVQNAGFNSGAYKPGLEHMAAFDRILGGGESLCAKMKFIHVAGTNGKGSVCHMMASSLAAGGLRTGLYTSPHLEDFRERVKIVTTDGAEMIPEEEVSEFIRFYGADFDRLGLSFFEITTGLAFWYFNRAGVDVTVLETGLGGRLDSTNIVRPVLSIVTSIGLDHCAILGDTREKIAAEKAGIFKEGVPALVGERDIETEGVFAAKAHEAGAHLYFSDEFPEAPEISMDLRGEYQNANIRTVLAAHSILGVTPSMKAIAHTAVLTGLHGRWESAKLAGADVIMDIGHNEPALRKNVAQLDGLVGKGKRYSRLIIVYGVMADKDYGSILQLLPAGAEYVFTTPSTPRALGAEEILISFRLAGRKETAFTSRCVEEALEKAKSLTESKNALIYVGGSAFVVADAIKSRVLSIF